MTGPVKSVEGREPSDTVYTTTNGPTVTMTPSFQVVNLTPYQLAITAHGAVGPDGKPVLARLEISVVPSSSVPSDVDGPGDSEQEKR